MALRQSETLAAKNSEYVLQTQKAYTDLTDINIKLENLKTEKDAISNKLKTALESGKTAAEILDLQKEFAAKSEEHSKAEFYNWAIFGTYLSASAKATPIQAVTDTLDDGMSKLISAGVQKKIDTASKDMSKAFVVLNTAKTEEAAAQGKYDILNEELNTAIAQGADTADLLRKLNASGSDLVEKKSATLRADKGYKAALQTYNDLYNTQTIPLPSTFAMQGAEISTIMSTVTATTTLSISSINAAKNNTLTRNLTQTYSQMMQLSTIVQQTQAFYDNVTADFNSAIDQGKTLAEIQGLRSKLQDASKQIVTDKSDLINKTTAYTNSLLNAVESPDAKSILDALAQAQAKVTQGAKANALLNTLMEAKQLVFALNAEDAAAQSELLVANSAIQIATAGGNIPQEKYDAVLAASNRAAVIRNKLIKANTAMMNAQINIDMDPNAEAINALATTKYIQQNTKAESNSLTAQYNDAKAKEAATYAALDVAKKTLETASAAFDSAISSGTDLQTIQNARDTMNAAASQVNAANQAETYAKAALNMAIENSKMSPVANALVVTQRVNDENVVAGARTTTQQYKLDLLKADLTKAEAAAAAAATAAAAARANLNASTADAISQEMVELRSLATSKAEASDAAQTQLDRIRRSVLDQQTVVDAATAAFQATQAAVAANNIANFLLFNGFLFQQSSDRYVLQPSYVPSTVTEGVSIPLDTINILPVDLGVYDPSGNYSLGSLVTYPDDEGGKYMCLVSSQDPRGASFTTITNKSPAAFPTVWIQIEAPMLRYRSNTDLLISSATVQGSLISVGIASGELQGMQTLFTNSLANGNNTLLHGLTIFGPGLPTSTVSSPATITLTAYTNSRANLNITASKSFLAQGGNIYIKNGKTILSAAVLAYNTYITNLTTAGFVPDVRLGHLTESFIDTTKLPGTITAGTPFALGSSTITPTNKGIYNAATSYTTGDIVTDTFTSKYICLVGPMSTGATYSITGTAPVETPGSSIYWLVIDNKSWTTLTFDSSTDLNLQITGFGSLLWTSAVYPPNTVIQLDSNFLQGYTLFGSGITQRTTATSSTYGFASSNYSYKLNLDVATSSNLSNTFYVKNGSSLFASATTSKLSETLALFMNNAATNALAVVNSTTDAQATSNYDAIVNPGIATLGGLYASNSSFMSLINVASTITGQCKSSANTHKSLLALRNSGQVSSNDYNTAKTTNTTRFTAIQTRVTSAAAAVSAQNAASANSNVALITAEQANIVADPTVRVYLLAADYVAGATTWNDRSGNGRNATLLGGTRTKSAAGNSIVLNGSTAWQFGDVNVGNAWTASVWYKQTGTNGANAYILTQGFYNGTNKNNINMGRGNNSVGNNNFNSFGFYNLANNQTVYPNSINLDSNVWVNLQLTWNGSNMSLYRDGSLVQTVTSGGVSETSGLNYHIGWRQDASSYVTGEIGEVRILSRALGAADVSKIYLENLALVTGLKAWYSAADYSGSGAWADKTGSGNSATILFGTAAKTSTGNAVVFDGTTSWTFPNVAVGNAWSVSVWYKKYSTATGNSVILSQTQTGANNIFISDTNGNNTIAVGFKAMSDNTLRQTTGTPITQELWANIQTTWDGTTLKTYLNGVLNASATPGGTSADSGTAYILGSDTLGGQSNFIKGEIAEVRIYNRALIQAEVTNIYSTTLGPVTGVRAWFTASEYSGTGAWLDKSGYGNNATADRGTITLNSDSNGLSLDGARSMVFSNTKVGNAWTITAWYRITGAIGTGASILTQVTSGTVNPNATLGYISGTNLSAGFANANTWTNGGTIGLVTNVWTNIHATWDGANIRSYINGVLVSTVPSSATAVDNNLGYRIGASWNANTSLLGELGELRMYNRPLTQAEITADYNSLAASYNFPVSIPSGISNLRFWLDAADPNATGTAPAVNTTLTTWKDKSTNAAVPTISGSSTGLVYAGPVNAITWNGSSYLTLPNGTLPNGNSSFTYFFIIKSPNQTNLRLVNIGTSNSVGTQLGLHYRSIDVDFFQPDLTTTVPPANQINNIAISYDNVTTRRSIWMNAANRQSHLLMPTYTTTPQNLPTTSQIIGGNSGGGEIILGNLYEVLVYSKALTPAERQGVEGYLAWKWGFQTTLPSTHPYRNAPLAAPSTPRGLTGSMITESAFTVSWTGGDQATSYTYTLNGVTTTPTTNNGTTSKSAVFSGLSPLTAHTVVVTAVNAVGSATSSSVSVTTIADVNIKAGLQLWLDGNDPYSMTRTATNTITGWKDKSGLLNTLSISGSATGLTYSGTNAVAWSGSYLTLTNGTLPNGNSSFTYFFVVKTPNQNNTRLVNIGTSNTVGTQLGLHYRGSDMNFFQPDLTTTVPPANQINIITISYNSTTRVRTIALNAATGATDTLASALNLPTTSHIIGANASAGEVFSGNFYDVLVYSTALSTAQRQNVEGYLAWKWGIQTTLPSNHPYRNSAPA